MPESRSRTPAVVTAGFQHIRESEALLEALCYSFRVNCNCRIHTAPRITGPHATP